MSKRRQNKGKLRMAISAIVHALFGEFTRPEAGLSANISAELEAILRNDAAAKALQESIESGREIVIKVGDEVFRVSSKPSTQVPLEDIGPRDRRAAII